MRLRAVVDRLGGLDIVVNNAGVGVVGPLIVETTDEQWRGDRRHADRGLLLHAGGRAAPAAAGHGSVVNIASVRGLTSNPGRIAYCAAKAAVLMMTKVAAGEWGPRNVRANAICPGWQRTPMSEADLASGVVTEQQLLDAVPLGRLGEPREIARLVAYLCGPDAGYISGAEITVDGG